jgi:hypothetical protein
MSTWSTIISVILLVIFLISGVLITNAAINIASFQDTDVFFQNAHYYATWAAVVIWGLFSLTIIGIGAYIFYTIFYAVEVPEAQIISSLSKPAESSGSWNILFSILIFILVIIVGALSAAAAWNFDQSKNYNPNVPQQYRAREELLVTAILSLSATGLILIIFLIDLIYYFSPAEEPVVSAVITPAVITPAAIAPAIPVATTASDVILKTSNNFNLNNLTADDLAKLKQLLK